MKGFQKFFAAFTRLSLRIEKVRRYYSVGANTYCSLVCVIFTHLRDSHLFNVISTRLDFQFKQLRGQIRFLNVCVFTGATGDHTQLRGLCGLNKTQSCCSEGRWLLCRCCMVCNSRVRLRCVSLWQLYILSLLVSRVYLFVPVVRWCITVWLVIVLAWLGVFCSACVHYRITGYWSSYLVVHTRRTR